MTTRITRTERIARDRVSYHIWRMDRDAEISDITLRENVPEAWHTIMEDYDCEEPKVKVTLYLDKSVAKVFRAMGRGYQARINRILQTWIQLRAANLLEVERNLMVRMGREFAERKEEGEG